MTVLWLQFAACTMMIVYSGTKLARYGDVIAEKTGMGRAWVGLILMASVTSLPELVTGISSVTFAGTPNIAVGNVLGACVFNLSIIALLDMLHGPGPIFCRAEHGHILSAGYSTILACVVGVSILARDHIPVIGSIGLYTPLIIGIYITGIRSVFLFEKRKIAEFVSDKAEMARYGNITARSAAMRYALHAVIIILVATLLPFIGERLAEHTGLGSSFFGTVFIAMATTLPELTVSVSALRIGAADMAIANLLGSNMFNIFILALDDLLYVPGPLLSDVTHDHAITAFMAALMTGIVVVGLTYRLQKKTVLRLGWDAVALLLAYIANISLLYVFRDKG